jgi:lysophospholipase L1-like esterase
VRRCPWIGPACPPFRTWLVAGLAGVAIVAFAVSRAAYSPDAPPLDVAVVGDSFAEQAAPAMLAMAGERGVLPEVVAFGGTAVCDRDDAFTDFAARDPGVLVVSFAGNDLTFLDASPDTAVYVVPPAPVRNAWFDANAAAMRTMYDDSAADHPGVEVVDVTPALGPDGQYHASLPCESWESAVCAADGTVQLRQQDGIHLTPAGGARYARAVLDTVGPAVSGR